MPSLLNFFRRKMRPLRDCVDAPHVLSTASIAANVKAEEKKESPSRRRVASKPSSSATSGSCAKKRRNLNLNLKLKRNILHKSVNLARIVTPKVKCKLTGSALASASTSACLSAAVIPAAAAITKMADSSDFSSFDHSSGIGSKSVSSAEDMLSPLAPMNRKKSNVSLAKYNQDACDDMVPASSVAFGHQRRFGLVSTPSTDNSWSSTHQASASILMSASTSSPAVYSMVTYNTKYADYDESTNAVCYDDDGLVSSSTSGVAASSSPSSSNGAATGDDKTAAIQQKQSTPFSDSHAAKRMSNGDMLEAFGFELGGRALTTVAVSFDNRKAKCRRSNTACAMGVALAATQPRNNRIIDYFSKLEMSKTMKKAQRSSKINMDENEQTSAKTREKLLFKYRSAQENLNESYVALSCGGNGIRGSNNKIRASSSSKDKDKERNEDDDVKSTTSSSGDEMEKIEDMFFQDSSYSLLPPPGDALKMREAKTKLLDQSAVDAALLSVLAATPNLPTDAAAVELSASSSSSSSASARPTHTSSSSSYSSCAVEKPRRSISMPGLRDANVNAASASLLLATANVSRISAIDESAPNQSEATHPPTAPTQTPTRANLALSIKEMFESVLCYQKNALQSLEKFYEAQLARIETDRRRSLAAAAGSPVDLTACNEYFDKQLRLLEERVHASLTFICQNKCKKLSTMSSCSAIGAASSETRRTGDEGASQQRDTALSKRLIQIVALKQLQKKQQQQRSFNAVASSKKLAHLKNNVNLLPSKSSAATVTASVQQANKPANLESLRQYIPNAKNQSDYRSPRTLKLNYSHSRPKQYKPQPNAAAANKRYSATSPYKSSRNQADTASGYVTATHEIRNELAKIIKLSANGLNSDNKATTTGSCPQRRAAWSSGARKLSMSDMGKELAAGSPLPSVEGGGGGFDQMLSHDDWSFITAAFTGGRVSCTHGHREAKNAEQLNASASLDNSGYVKFVAPRLSDSHLLCRLKQQQAAASDEKQAFVNGGGLVSRFESSSSVASSKRSSTSQIETQV